MSFNKKVTIEYVKDKDKFLVTAPYSVETNKVLNANGFFYSGEIKKHQKSASVHDMAFLLSIPDTLKSESFRSYISSNQKALDALTCHRDKLGNGIEIPETARVLHTHQKVAVKFIRSNDGKCILGDEWGVGKTYPALVYTYEQEGKVLILCRKDLVANWESEIRALFFEQDLLESKFLVRCYDAHKEIEDLKDSCIHLIIDESHNLSDLTSKRFSTANKQSKKSKSIILLTGNSVGKWAINFYSQLKLLGMDMTKDKYLKRFFNILFENNRYVPTGLKGDGLKFFISTFYLRRKLSDIAPDLEGKNEVFKVQLNEFEMKVWAKAVRERGIILSGGKVVELNQTLSRLKVNHLVKYCKFLLKENPDKKFAIASQFPDLIKELQKELPFIRPFPEKAQVVFMDSGEFREGHNGTDYDFVILLDTYANKLHNQQIKRRFLRLGQKQKVTCLYFLAGELDQELLAMPDFSTHEKVTEHLAKYFAKKDVQYGQSSKVAA